MTPNSKIAGHLPMRNILVVHQAAELYGSDRAILMLAQGLLASEAWWPIVVVPRDGPLVAVMKKMGVEVHVADVLNVSRSTASLLGVGRLIASAVRCTNRLDRIVAGRPISLVHSNTISVLGGALWARRRGRPHVWHVHEIVLSPAPARRGFPLLVHALSDRVIANSRQTLGWLLKQQPALQRISTVVFNGLTTPTAPPTTSVRRVREQLRAGNSEVLVSLVGRLNHWKGHQVLLDAIEKLKNEGRGEHIRVAIVGSPFSGHEKVASDLMEQCRRQDLGSFVSFMPFVDDIWPIWYATDIAVVPSTEPEPFGLVAIEAMAAGVPVVASRHGGLTDIVEDGTTGRLVSPGDSTALASALDQLANDVGIRKSMGEAGRARQQALFSAKNYIGGVMEVYENLGRDKTFWAHGQ
jgi:glycosyltransferase involved in cell wall biosynthesis